MSTMSSMALRISSRNWSACSRWMMKSRLRSATYHSRLLCRDRASSKNHPKIAAAVTAAITIIHASITDLSAFEAVADAAHRHDPLGVRGIVLDFLAQPAHMHVYRLGLPNVIVAPDAF